MSQKRKKLEQMYIRFGAFKAKSLEMNVSQPREVWSL